MHEKTRNLISLALQWTLDKTTKLCLVAQQYIATMHSNKLSAQTGLNFEAMTQTFSYGSWTNSAHLSLFIIKGYLDDWSSN